ncbi:uncharacterized protein A4U43_UnF4480 [Asparagus officinalis]|uniref:Uncharacterized protein n=1 Tax=Asparagus officinalis TaxID=4686 RepID=A0A1R3L6U6_ASPOF|nr:uncharacterized protein A4U43_UnF4480 [Asparagus officinalis]
MEAHEKAREVAKLLAATSGTKFDIVKRGQMRWKCNQVAWDMKTRENQAPQFEGAVKKRERDDAFEKAQVARVDADELKSHCKMRRLSKSCFSGR